MRTNPKSKRDINMNLDELINSMTAEQIKAQARATIAMNAFDKALQEATERFKNCIVRETVKGQNSMINGSCKVILNDNPYNNINMRHFEAISAGAVLVTRKPQESAIEQLGLSDSVLFYENKKEAMDQIDFALKNIKRFDEPAEALAAHYWQNHSYTNKLELGFMVKILRCLKFDL